VAATLQDVLTTRKCQVCGRKSTGIFHDFLRQFLYKLCFDLAFGGRLRTGSVSQGGVYPAAVRRGMGILPMVHGQDARATQLGGRFCDGRRVETA
jgi:hypothetical protein